jgi:hypothetical protein
VAPRTVPQGYVTVPLMIPFSSLASGTVVSEADPVSSLNLVRNSCLRGNKQARNLALWLGLHGEEDLEQHAPSFHSEATEWTFVLLPIRSTNALMLAKAPADAV